MSRLQPDIHIDGDSDIEQDYGYNSNTTSGISNNNNAAVAVAAVTSATTVAEVTTKPAAAPAAPRAQPALPAPPQALPLPAVPSVSRHDLSALLALASASRSRFIDVCLLSGCDYLPSLPRMGVKTALRMFLETETGSGEEVLAVIAATEAAEEAEAAHTRAAKAAAASATSTDSAALSDGGYASVATATLQPSPYYAAAAAAAAASAAATATTVPYLSARSPYFVAAFARARLGFRHSMVGDLAALTIAPAMPSPPRLDARFPFTPTGLGSSGAAHGHCWRDTLATAAPRVPPRSSLNPLDAAFWDQSRSTPLAPRLGPAKAVDFYRLRMHNHAFVHSRNRNPDAASARNAAHAGNSSSSASANATDGAAVDSLLGDNALTATLAMSDGSSASAAPAAVNVPELPVCPQCAAAIHTSSTDSISNASLLSASFSANNNNALLYNGSNSSNGARAKSGMNKSGGAGITVDGASRGGRPIAPAKAAGRRAAIPWQFLADVVRNSEQRGARSILSEVAMQRKCGNECEGENDTDSVPPVGLVAAAVSLLAHDCSTGASVVNDSGVRTVTCVCCGEDNAVSADNDQSVFVSLASLLFPATVIFAPPPDLWTTAPPPVPPSSARTYHLHSHCTTSDSCAAAEHGTHSGGAALPWVGAPDLGSKAVAAAAACLPFVSHSYSALSAHAPTPAFAVMGVTAHGAAASVSASPSTSASTHNHSVYGHAPAPGGPPVSGKTYRISRRDLCFLGPPLPPAFVLPLLLGAMCPRSLLLQPRWEDEALAAAQAWRVRFESPESHVKSTLNMHMPRGFMGRFDIAGALASFAAAVADADAREREREERLRRALANWRAAEQQQSHSASASFHNQAHSTPALPPVLGLGVSKALLQLLALPTSTATAATAGGANTSAHEAGPGVVATGSGVSLSLIPLELPMLRILASHAQRSSDRQQQQSASTVADVLSGRTTGTAVSTSKAELATAAELAAATAAGAKARTQAELAACVLLHLTTNNSRNVNSSFNSGGSVQAGIPLEPLTGADIALALGWVQPLLTVASSAFSILQTGEAISTFSSPRARGHVDAHGHSGTQSSTRTPGHSARVYFHSYNNLPMPYALSQRPLTRHHQSYHESRRCDLFRASDVCVRELLPFLTVAQCSTFYSLSSGDSNANVAFSATSNSGFSAGATTSNAAATAFDWADATSADNTTVITVRPVGATVSRSSTSATTGHAAGSFAPPTAAVLFALIAAQARLATAATAAGAARTLSRVAGLAEDGDSAVLAEADADAAVAAAVAFLEHHDVTANKSSRKPSKRSASSRPGALTTFPVLCGTDKVLQGPSDFCAPTVVLALARAARVRAQNPALQRMRFSFNTRLSTDTANSTSASAVVLAGSTRESESPLIAQCVTAAAPFSVAPTGLTLGAATSCVRGMLARAAAVLAAEAVWAREDELAASKQLLDLLGVSTSSYNGHSNGSSAGGFSFSAPASNSGTAAPDGDGDEGAAPAGAASGGMSVAAAAAAAIACVREWEGRQTRRRAREHKRTLASAQRNSVNNNNASDGHNVSNSSDSSASHSADASGAALNTEQQEAALHRAWISGGNEPGDLDISDRALKDRSRNDRRRTDLSLDTEQLQQQRELKPAEAADAFVAWLTKHDNAYYRPILLLRLQSAAALVPGVPATLQQPGVVLSDADTAALLSNGSLSPGATERVRAFALTQESAHHIARLCHIDDRDDVAAATVPRSDLDPRLALQALRSFAYRRDDEHTSKHTHKNSDSKHSSTSLAEHNMIVAGDDNDYSEADVSNGVDANKGASLTWLTEMMEEEVTATRRVAQSATTNRSPARSTPQKSSTTATPTKTPPTQGRTTRPIIASSAGQGASRSGTPAAARAAGSSSDSGSAARNWSQYDHDDLQGLSQRGHFAPTQYATQHAPQRTPQRPASSNSHALIKTEPGATPPLTAAATLDSLAATDRMSSTHENSDESAKPKSESDRLEDLNPAATANIINGTSSQKSFTNNENEVDASGDSVDGRKASALAMEIDYGKALALITRFMGSDESTSVDQNADSVDDAEALAKGLPDGNNVNENNDMAKPATDSFDDSRATASTNAGDHEDHDDDEYGDDLDQHDPSYRNPISNHQVPYSMLSGTFTQQGTLDAHADIDVAAPVAPTTAATLTVEDMVAQMLGGSGQKSSSNEAKSYDDDRDLDASDNDADMYGRTASGFNPKRARLSSDGAGASSAANEFDDDAFISADYAARMRALGFNSHVTSRRNAHSDDNYIDANDMQDDDRDRDLDCVDDDHGDNDHDNGRHTGPAVPAAPRMLSGLRASLASASASLGGLAPGHGFMNTHAVVPSSFAVLATGAANNKTTVRRKRAAAAPVAQPSAAAAAEALGARDSVKERARGLVVAGGANIFKTGAAMGLAGVQTTLLGNLTPVVKPASAAAAAEGKIKSSSRKVAAAATTTTPIKMLTGAGAFQSLHDEDVFKDHISKTTTESSSKSSSTISSSASATAQSNESRSAHVLESKTDSITTASGGNVPSKLSRLFGLNARLSTAINEETKLPISTALKAKYTNPFAVSKTGALPTGAEAGLATPKTSWDRTNGKRGKSFKDMM